MSQKKDNRINSGRHESMLDDYARIILETSIDGFCIINTEGGFVDVNSAYCEMLGYSREEFIGLRITDIEARETEDDTTQRIVKVIKAGHDRFETRQRCKDGKVLDVEVSTQLCETEKGKMFFSFFRDITARKQAEEALRESEQRYKTVFEGAAEGILVAERSTKKILYTNSCIREMLGYSKEEMEGMSVKKLHAKGGWEQVHSGFRSRKQGEKMTSPDIPFLRKDGTIIYMNFNTVHVKIDGKECGVAFCTDITDRKKGEEALRESELRYKSLFEGAVEGILVADTETQKFMYANPALCGMLGYSEEEMKRMGVEDIHSEDDLEYVLSEFEAQVQGKKALATYIPCLRKDGTIIYADVNSAMTVIDGRMCNVGFFTDVTKYKRIKSELEQYKERVFQAQKHAYVSSMGAIVAHQVNQPLTKLNILLDRAVEQMEEKGCCPDVLKDVKEGVEQVKETTLLIRKFRRHSKGLALESGGKANAGNVADKILSILSEKARQTRMRIVTSSLDGLNEVEISEAALEQIFLIIVQNAIEAADGTKQHKLEIGGKHTDDKIELRFSDDCCGIAEENLEKIFEPFFSTKSEDKGMGLGLDIVQQILLYWFSVNWTNPLCC